MVEIRKLNPSITWDLPVLRCDLPLMAESEALDGLIGRIETSAYSLEDLDNLNKVCEKCHPTLEVDLELDISKYKTDNICPIQLLAAYTPILKRLRKLDPEVIFPGGLESEQAVSCLDAICEQYDFALVMEGASDCCKLCDGRAHILRRLVKLHVSDPQTDDLIWLDRTLQEHHFEVSLEAAVDLQILKNCIHPHWSIHHVDILRPLESQGDANLFKQILREHPKMQYRIEVSHAGIMNILLDNDDDLPLEIYVSFIHYDNMLTCKSDNRSRGLSVKCESHHLHHMSALDLSSRRWLKLILTDNEGEFDSALMASILARCPGLETLKIDTKRVKGSLGEFAGVVQKAFQENWWSNLKRVQTTDSRLFSDSITLPASFREAFICLRWPISYSRDPEVYDSFMILLENSSYIVHKSYIQ